MDFISYKKIILTRKLNITILLYILTLKIQSNYENSIRVEIFYPIFNKQFVIIRCMQEKLFGLKINRTLSVTMTKMFILLADIYQND